MEKGYEYKRIEHDFPIILIKNYQQSLKKNQ